MFKFDTEERYDETKAILPDRLCFSVYCVGKSLQKRHSPRPNAVPSPLPLFTGAMRHGTNAKGWTEHVRGLFSVKKPPVSSIQAAFGYIPQPPQPPPPQGPPPRKGLGGIGRTGPTLKGFAPCFRFAAESSRSVSALPQLGQGGQASSGPTMSSNSQEQEEQ